jgi:hypothetical protein
MRGVLASAFVMLACSSASGGGAAAQGDVPTTPSTDTERTALCDATIPKCQAYQGLKSACVTENANVSECFANAMQDCVTKAGTCTKTDFASCQASAVQSCEPNTSPQYVAQCKDRNASCKAAYNVLASDLPATVTRIDSECALLPALAQSGRDRASACIGAPCGSLEKCLEDVLP